MIKLLIVEDEHFERKYISDLLSRDYQGRIFLTPSARDGLTAIEIARAECPDIILMDINIPKMDGLEAAQLIRAELPETIIIILTAYSSFQYAQRAINIGAKRYLLKPYEDQEIILVLEDAIAEIAQKRQKKMTTIAQRDMMRYMSDVVEKELIYDIISSGDWEKAIQYMDFLSIEECKVCYCIGILNSTVLINAELFKTDISNIASQVIGTVFGNKGVFFAFLKNESFALNELETKLAVERALQKQNAGGSRIFLSTCHAKDQILLCYQEMNRKMSQSQHSSEKPVISIDKNLFSLESQLFQTLFQHDISLIDHTLDRIELLFSENIPASDSICKPYNEYCKQLYLSCCKQIMQDPDIEIHMQDIFWDFGRIDAAPSFHQAGVVLRDLIRNLFILIEQNQSKEPHRVAEELRRYIQSNYMRNITLNDAAKALHFSYGHLSRCFNRAYGLKFNDYLLTVRIERAKELINSGKSLSEIAYETGFSDPSYFGKVFKKIVGVSPKQYRESPQ